MEADGSHSFIWSSEHSMCTTSKSKTLSLPSENLQCDEETNLCRVLQHRMWKVFFHLHFLPLSVFASQQLSSEKSSLTTHPQVGLEGPPSTYRTLRHGQAGNSPREYFSQSYTTSNNHTQLSRLCIFQVIITLCVFLVEKVSNWKSRDYALLILLFLSVCGSRQRDLECYGCVVSKRNEYFQL